jgi:hypothetical protein
MQAPLSRCNTRIYGYFVMLSGGVESNEEEALFGTVALCQTVLW